MGELEEARQHLRLAVRLDARYGGRALQFGICLREIIRARGGAANIGSFTFELDPGSPWLRIRAPSAWPHRSRRMSKARWLGELAATEATEREPRWRDKLAATKNRAPLRKAGATKAKAAGLRGLRPALQVSAELLKSALTGRRNAAKTLIAPRFMIALTTLLFLAGVGWAVGGRIPLRRR